MRFSLNSFYVLTIIIIVLILIFDIKETFVPETSIERAHNYDTYKLHNICNSLSNKSCSAASYCVLLNYKNKNKCVGGSKLGPTYHTNNGNTIKYDNYIYKNKNYN